MSGAVVRVHTEYKRKDWGEKETKSQDHITTEEGKQGPHKTGKSILQCSA